MFIKQLQDLQFYTLEMKIKQIMTLNLSFTRPSCIIAAEHFGGPVLLMNNLQKKACVPAAAQLVP